MVGHKVERTIHLLIRRGTCKQGTYQSQQPCAFVNATRNSTVTPLLYDLFVLTTASVPSSVSA